MGFLPPGITVIGAAALNLLSPILFMSRSIGGFVANVTLEEDHNDEIEITDHPVEYGASITDHAFKRPPSVIITCGWSNSSIAALGNPFYVNQVYQAFLDMQASVIPFDIFTGKRFYSDMLAKRISCKTDEKTENALLLTVECRNIQIVSTQVVSSGLGSQANMKDPVVNSGVTDLGQQSAKTVTNLSIRNGANLGVLGQ